MNTEKHFKYIRGASSLAKGTSYLTHTNIELDGSISAYIELFY